MKFCPHCGGLMVPIKKNDKPILKCTKCGFEMETSINVAKEYKMEASVSAESRVLTTSLISEPPKRRLRSKEEYEQEREEWYEVALEIMQAEEGGEEE